MKKYLVILLFALGAVGAMAQRTTVKFQDTQARMLNIESNAYVKPMTVELKMLDGGKRIHDVWELTAEEMNSMGKEIANIRSYAVFKSSVKHDADIIVGATFNIISEDTSHGCKVEIIGFPANFINWKTATSTDLDWIRLEKVNTISEKDKIKPIVK